MEMSVHLKLLASLHAESSEMKENLDTVVRKEQTSMKIQWKYNDM